MRLYPSNGQGEQPKIDAATAAAAAKARVPFVEDPMSQMMRGLARRPRPVTIPGGDAFLQFGRSAQEVAQMLAKGLRPVDGGPRRR